MASESPAEELAQLTAKVERLKRTLDKLDKSREQLLKQRPPGSKGSAQDVEAKIREMAQAMERASLTVREEKATLAEMKRMRDLNKKMIQWEASMDEKRSERATLGDALQELYHEMNRCKRQVWLEEVSAEMKIPLEELHDVEVPVGEGMLELLSTSLWKKRLQSEFNVVARVTRSRSLARLLGARESVDSALALINDFGPVDVRKLDVDEAQQGLLIGRKGATISQLQESTGCALELRNTQLVIAGAAGAAETAEQRILEMLESQKRVEVIVKFDPEQKGTLLGKGGATIKRIQQESGGAVIDLSKEGECTVKLSGPNASVEKARRAVVELLHLDAESVRVVEVPTDIVDIVLGKGGEKLRHLESEHSVSIDSNHRLITDKSAEVCRFKVRGSVDGVKRAVEVLGKLVERERKVEESLDVETHHVGMLLGKGGMTINAIQRQTGAVLDVQKRANEGSSMQRVSIKGNSEQVGKALMALEGVLQYKAECNESVTVDPRMMHLLIGKAGEQINLIRSKSGAAIDADREKHLLKIRGTVAAVAEAKRAIVDTLAANKHCAESVVLPWHAIDVLIGPNASKLIALEAEHHVQIELPGQSLASDVVGSGSFLGISSSMTLRGRKKFVDAAAAEIRRIEREFAVETIELGEEDAELLSRLCLDAEGATPLETLQLSEGVAITFSPLSGVVIMRGEETLAARAALLSLLARERWGSEGIACDDTQAELLLAAGSALEELQEACTAEGVVVAMQHDPPMVFVSGATHVLAAAKQQAAAWLSAHQAVQRSLTIPPEVVPQLRSGISSLLPSLPAGVTIEMGEDDVLRICGPECSVDATLAQVSTFVRRHARREERLELSAEGVALACLLRNRNILEGVELVREGECLVLLKGTEEGVGKAMSRLEAVLSEAERCGVVLPLNLAQLEKLCRTMGRERETLLRKLQETHECALIADRQLMQLRLHGRAEAVVRMQAAIEVELDIDEHVRSISSQMVPIIIGKGGATIKRLQQSSGATFDLDRDRGRLRIFGRKLCVSKALLMLDELNNEFGAFREIEVAQRQISHIIGRGGATIKGLQSESGATIDIRKDDCVVRIKGSQAAVEHAVRRIEELLAPPLSSTQTTEGSRQQRTDGQPRTSGRTPPGLRHPKVANGGPPPGLGTS